MNDFAVRLPRSHNRPGDHEPMQSHTTKASQSQNLAPQTKWKRYEKFKPDYNRMQQRVKRREVEVKEAAIIIRGSHLLRLSKKCYPINKTSPHNHNMDHKMNVIKLITVELLLICCLLTIVPICQAFNSFNNQVNSFHHQNNTPQNYHQIYNSFLNGPQNMIQTQPLPQVELPSGASRFGGFGTPNVGGLVGHQHHHQWIQTPQPPPRQHPSNQLMPTAAGLYPYPAIGAKLPMQLAQINQVAHRRNEIQQQQPQQQLVNPYQAYQLQPVRPAKLMAEYVANQGQRILKNLVNTTIADLVNQSTMKMNANKNIMMNLNTNQPTTPANLLAGVVPFPKMNKLYTLLFPTPSPPVVFVPATSQSKAANNQHQPNSANNQTDQEVTDNANTDTQSSSSINHQEAGSSVASSSADATADMYLNESQGREEKQPQQQALSLGAPYESQPRPSSTLMGLRSPRHQQSGPRLHGFQTQMDSGLSMESINGDEWRRPDNDDVTNSLSQQEAQGFFDNQQQQQQQQFDSDDLNDNTNHHPSSFRNNKPEMDTDSLGSFESAELIVPRHIHGGSSAMSQRNVVDTDTRKPIIIHDSELYSHHNHDNNHDRTSLNQTSGQLEDDFRGASNTGQQFASGVEPEFSLGSHGMRHVGGDQYASNKHHTMLNSDLMERNQFEQPDDSPSNQSSSLSHDEVAMSQAQESIESMGGDIPEGAELSIQVPQRNKPPRQPKRFQNHKQRHHNHHHKHMRDQQPIMEMQTLNQVELGDEQDLASNNQRQSFNGTREVGGSGEIENRFHHQQDGMSVHGGYANEEPSSTSEQPALKISGMGNLLNGSSSGKVANQQADDSYFTAHLPSQYEAVMRLPPDGYYDDYFKPPNSQSSLIHHSPSSMPITSPHESDSNSAAMPEFGPSSSSTQSNSNNNNNDNGNNLIEGAVQFETVTEASNFTSGSVGDGPSGRSKKHWVPPSYHSQIITTDNSQQFDGNNSNSYNYSQQQQQQPIAGQTKQYYANQQQATAVAATNSRSPPPVDNSNYNNDAPRIEFVTPGSSGGSAGGNNRTIVSEEKGNLESLNYEIPSIYEKASPSNNNQQQMILKSDNVTLEPIPMNEQRVVPINNTHRYQTLMTPRGNSTPSAINSPPQQQLISPNEDSIKLIIANTISDLRDPQSNEKLINYTSEGHNITRGKSPRNNFINKDMNEFPPADQPATVVQPDQLLEQQDGQRGLMLHPNALGQQQPTPAGAKHITSGHHPQVLLPQFPRPSHTPAASAVVVGTSNQQRPPTSMPARNQVYQQQQVVAGPDEQQVAQGGEEETEDDQQYKTVQRIVEPADGKHLAMDLRDNNQRPHVEVHHEQHHQDHHNDHVEQQQRQPSSPSEHQNQPSTDGDHATNRGDDESDAADQQQEQPKIRNRKQLSGQKVDDSILREDRKRERRARQRGRFSKQQTIARPQITQVSFSPKDLAMNPPKPLPTTSDGSPLEAIAEIPRKVEQLRENQPDKNELMNELLTALDRVKVAIYKLQPLTAKMNAIYRKSVTSNTRDIIMDNHKGTYAKRYPPGDYDDTYDRMHPSELLTRQQAASQRSSATGAGATTGSGNTKQPEVEANESVENAVYLPAPKEVLEKHKRDSSLSGDGQRQQQHQLLVANVELDSLNALESKIIATGIGRRLGDGRVMGRLSLDSGEKLIYDDEGFDETNSTSNTTATSINRPLPSFFPPLNQSAIAGEGDIQEPLFGYRITIYRSPEATEPEIDSRDDGQDKSNDHLRYQVDQDDDDAPGNEDDEMEATSAASALDSTSGSGDSDAAEDLIATSESSLVDSIQQPMASEELGPSISIADPASANLPLLPQPRDGPKVGDSMYESESKGKKVEEKSGSHDKKKKKMMMMKKKKSHMHKKKRNEEESKKKKEYRKIKHEKGIISKEKKTMKRDKHIKAHDRGAAKEKALKERTQIEFFEREQIVDDEFEKGKKSTVKGGWQSGQDSKKSIRDTSGSGGDTMSSGGSHYVEHEMPKEMGGGHKVSSEASSAKKSNKFEKKEMEAKGKKFKGWREKGYKIITETEFIDRGSLHDSAYKKRDKGAAHHQKFKKQEASSEGHHGSLLEHHKKSNKKEEKKSNEKKGEEMMKKKKKKKEQQKKMEIKKKEDHKHEESVISATSEPEDDNNNNGDDERPLYQRQHQAAGDQEDSPTPVGRDEHRRGRGIQPMLMSATSSTFRPALIMPQNSEDSVQTRTLIRLLNSNVHDEQQQPHHHHQQPVKSYNIQPKGQMDNDRVHQLNPVSHQRTRNSSQHSTVANEQNISSRYHLLNDTPSLNGGDNSNRRSDMPPNPTTTPQPSPQSTSKHQRSSNNGSSYGYPMDSSSSRASSSSPATILDIVDNLTGRQINKTKIGTYDLEDHHTIRLNSNGSTPLVKISNGLAKYFPFLATQAGQQSSNRSSSHMIHENPATTTSSTTTRRPTQPKQPSYLNNINLNDLLNPIPNQRSDLNFNNNFNSNTNNNLMMINQNHDKQQTIMTKQTQQASRTNEQQPKISPRPTTLTTTTTTDNPGVIQFAAGTQTTGAPPVGPFITSEQANAAAAAHLLQLVHRASQVNQIQNPLANHQPGGNLMDQLQPQVLQHPQLQSPINRVAPFLTSASSLATSPYQPGGPMFHPVAQMSFAPPPPPPSSDGPINFNGEQQFADYEHGPILRRTPFTS